MSILRILVEESEIVNSPRMRFGTRISLILSPILEWDLVQSILIHSLALEWDSTLNKQEQRLGSSSLFYCMQQRKQIVAHSLLYSLTEHGSGLATQWMKALGFRAHSEGLWSATRSSDTFPLAS